MGSILMNINFPPTIISKITQFYPIIYKNLLYQQYKMSSKYTFCYWDARSKQDAMLIIFNQTIVTTILVIAITRLPNLYRLIVSRFAIDVRKILLIHVLIIAWALTQSAVNYYSIIVYLSLSAQQSSTDMIAHSYVYTILNSIPASLVQSLFIFICYTLNLVRETSIRQFSKYSLKLVMVLKWYFFLRLLPWAAVLVLQSFASIQQIEQCLKIYYYMLIADSGITNLLIFLSIRIFISRLTHRHYKTLKVEYWTMFFCSICRIVIDIFFVNYDPTMADNKCVSESDVSLVYTLLFNVVQSYLMHIIPMAVILKIYTFDHRKMKEEDALIPRQEGTFIRESLNR